MGAAESGEADPSAQWSAAAGGPASRSHRHDGRTERAQGAHRGCGAWGRHLRRADRPAGTRGGRAGAVRHTACRKWGRRGGRGRARDSPHRTACSWPSAATSRGAPQCSSRAFVWTCRQISSMPSPRNGSKWTQKWTNLGKSSRAHNAILSGEAGRIQFKCELGGGKQRLGRLATPEIMRSGPTWAVWLVSGDAPGAAHRCAERAGDAASAARSARSSSVAARQPSASVPAPASGAQRPLI